MSGQGESESCERSGRERAGGQNGKVKKNRNVTIGTLVFPNDNYFGTEGVDRKAQWQWAYLQRSRNLKHCCYTYLH